MSKLSASQAEIDYTASKIWEKCFQRDPRRKAVCTQAAITAIQAQQAFEWREFLSRSRHNNDEKDKANGGAKEATEVSAEEITHPFFD